MLGWLRYINRSKKYNYFIKYFSPTASTKILDVGAADKEYSGVDNFLEKRYPCLANITVLGLHQFDQFRKRYPLVKAVTYDGRVFPFNDKKFDICWCSAVLEHVGDVTRQELFLREISRVSKRVFLTTPNRWFPFELHSKAFLLHYLPKFLFNKYLVALGQGNLAGDYLNLLSLNKLKWLLSKANIKDYKILKNRFCLFTVEFLISF
jgi:SAM-dependent methyltransferase